MLKFNSNDALFICCFISDDGKTLKEHLIDELDYVLLPTEGWNKLVSWYGTVEGQVSDTKL